MYTQLPILGLYRGIARLPPTALGQFWAVIRGRLVFHLPRVRVGTLARHCVASLFAGARDNTIWRAPIGVPR
jgi:hypothetical protein